MVTNERLENTLKGFQAFKSSFQEQAVQDACYCETYIDSDGIAATRRPIVIFHDESHAKHWRKQIDSWNAYVESLNNLAPTHFPKKSEILKAPDIRKGVTSIAIYRNTAVNSRLIDAAKLIKRLQAMVKQYDPENCRYFSAEKAAIHEQASKELAFFQSIEEEKLRIRNDGYYEILLQITYANGSEEKTRANEVGMFIEPATLANIKVKLPEDIAEQQRRSVYDDIEPIETILPITGKIYREKDVEKARKAAKK